MPKRDPEEVLKALEADDAPEGDEDMDRILALSPEELDAELRAAGLDPGEVDAKARATYAEMAPGAAPASGVARAQPAPSRAPASVARILPTAARRRLSTFAWVAAACVILPASAYLLARALKPKDDLVIRPDPSAVAPPLSAPQPVPSAPPELAQASALRSAAMTFCNEGNWETCRAKLDAATKLDPAGESAPEVQALRTWLTKHPKSAHPSPFPAESKER